MATAVAEPNWKELPVAIPIPYSQKVLRVASAGFVLLGTVFASVAYHVSSLRPRFLLGALAAASFLVAQRIFSVSRNYPKQLRIQAGAEIEKSGTFKDFGTKYRDLISQQILLRTDINFLIERDVQEMGYAAFMEKHANPDCKQALIDTLRASLRETLRSKCLVLFADRTQSPDKIDKALMAIMNFTDNQKAITAIDWDDFISEGGEPEEVTDPAALRRLKGHFLDKAYNRGVYTHDVDLFADDVKDSILQTLIIFDLELVADGELPVSEIIWSSIDGEDIADSIPKINPDKVEALKQKLREYYLANPSKFALKSVDFKKRREALEIADEMIDNAPGSILSDCRVLPYVGDKGFRRKYGTEPLTNGFLTEPLKEKIKAELRKYALEETDLGDWLYDDLILLGLVDEVLIQRWQKMSFLDIWGNEKDLFLKVHEFNPQALEQFKPQIIEVIHDLSILEIDSDLFLFLRPSDKSANGPTFAQLAEEAVREVGKLNSQVSRDTHCGESQIRHLVEYLDVFFETKLLDRTSPALREVLNKAIEEDGDKVFAISPAPHEHTIWNKLVLAWSVFDSQIEGRYHSACQEVQKAQATLLQKTKDIDDEKCVSEEQKASQEACDEALKLRKACRQKKAELSRKCSPWITKSKLGSKNFEIDRKKRTISTLQSELKGLSKVPEDLVAQIAALEAKAAPDGDYFVQLTKDVQALKINQQPELDLKEQELFQITEQFEILAQSRDILNTIRQEIADIPAKIGACEAAIGQAKQDLDRLVEKQAGLKKQLDDLQQEQEGLDQEYLRLERVHSKANKVLLDNSEAFNRSKEMRKADLQSQYDAFVQHQLDEMKKLLLDEQLSDASLNNDQVVSFSKSGSRETGLTRICCKRTTAFSDGRVVV